MKIKNMALIGIGMLGTLAIQKYGMPMVKGARKIVNEKMDMMEKEIEQMM